MMKQAVTGTGRRWKVLLGVAAILTLFRIWLAVNTPLFLQGDAQMDDYLMVRYAGELLGGRWLGNYGASTLVKTVSFPLILACNYLLGIPYSFGLILGYICAVFLLAKAISCFFRNSYVPYFLYLVLLFSPVMFHEENVQKVYRGGYIVVFSVLVFAAVIGMYGETVRRDRNIGRLFGWTMLGAAVLPVFWYLKEDSIWILPFVLVGILCGVIAEFRREDTGKQKIRRSMLLLLPLISLLAFSLLFKSLNYANYGVFAVTDRSGSEFEKVIADIQRIEDDTIDETWITRRMIAKACKASPTLHKLEPEIYEMMDGMYGKGRECYWDYFIWILRDVADRAGYYANGSGDAFRSLVIYRDNATTICEATGSDENVALMAQITNSTYTMREPLQQLSARAKIVVALDQFIVGLYRKTGKLIFLLSLPGLLLLFISAGKRLVRKNPETEGCGLAPILLGLSVSAGALFFGVLLFSNFLTARKIYDYTGGFIPVLNILEATGVYLFAAGIRSVVFRQKKAHEAKLLSHK
jgi:hypothetical protein